MDIILAILGILVSLYLMSKVVDDIFIKALDNISDSLKLTPSVAGATLMAFGTSAPEISTTMFSLVLANSNPATGLGTVVGSAIFQILVVIGFAALVKTSYLDWKPVARDGIFYTITILLLISVISDNQITVLDAGLLVFTYFVYLVLLFFWSRQFKEKRVKDPIDIVEKKAPESLDFYKYGKKTPFELVFAVISFPVDFIINSIPDINKKKFKKYTIPVFIGSLIAIGGLSYLLVLSAEVVALAVGIPTPIIALTILAGGTSVPELISSAIVSREGRGDMAISNAIGSNIFDILMSLGLPVLIYTILAGPITEEVLQESGGLEQLQSSVIILFVSMIFVLGTLVFTKFKIGRWVGSILITAYVIYVAVAYLFWI